MAMSDAKNNLQVVIRVRPPLPSDKENKENVVNVNEAEGQIIVGPSNSFSFDTCYDVNTTQDRVYQQSVAPMINQFVTTMCHTTILAYGQTGTGKSYTMFGKTKAMGIIPNSIRDIFESVDMSTDVVGVSFFEIHNEKLFDLLNPTKVPLKMRDEGPHFALQGLTTKWVSNCNEAMSAIKHGCSVRSTGTTDKNETSSRSHSIFTLTVAKMSDESGERIEAKFNCVDLAGSESVSKTNACGDRLKEANHMNKGLLALGNCISAIYMKNKHIPFRDSVLTKILQEYLQGDGLTTFIACISPIKYDMGETLNTLRFVDRAKNLKKPVIPANLKAQAQKRSLEQNVFPSTSKNSSIDYPNGKNGLSVRDLNTRARCDFRPRLSFTSNKKQITPMAPLLEESNEFADAGSMSFFDPNLTIPMYRHFAERLEELERTVCQLNEKLQMNPKEQDSPMSEAFSENEQDSHKIESTSANSSYQRLSDKETIDSGDQMDQTSPTAENHWSKGKQTESTITPDLETIGSEDDQATQPKRSFIPSSSVIGSTQQASGSNDEVNNSILRQKLLEVFFDNVSDDDDDDEDEDEDMIEQQSDSGFLNTPGSLVTTPIAAKKDESPNRLTLPTSAMAEDIGIDVDSPREILTVPPPPPPCDVIQTTCRRSTRRTTMIPSEIISSLSQSEVTRQRRQSSRIANNFPEVKNPLEALTKSNLNVSDQEKLHQNILDQLNKALDITMLQNIPGIGPKSASAIHTNRGKNGKLRTLEDLKTVPGLHKNFFSKFCQFNNLS